MKLTTIIIFLIAALSTISCTETPDFREFRVPEIINITSLPEIHSAVLVSDLKENPKGIHEVGFYHGTDKNHLERTGTVVTGKRFQITVLGLQENTTYYFKAYVTNGMNEISSGFETFRTGIETINPGIPEEPENPDEPEIPDDPEEPETPENPEIPEEPEVPVEFNVEIIGNEACYVNGILELCASVSGKTSLITECGFMIGTTYENLTRVQGSIEGNAVKAYLMGISEGTYFYKAFITNGSETKESDICQITISQN